MIESKLKQNWSLSSLNKRRIAATAAAASGSHQYMRSPAAAANRMAETQSRSRPFETDINPAWFYGQGNNSTPMANNQSTYLNLADASNMSNQSQTTPAHSNQFYYPHNYPEYVPTSASTPAPTPAPSTTPTSIPAPMSTPIPALTPTTPTPTTIPAAAPTLTESG